MLTAPPSIITPGKLWAEATPSGILEMFIQNPAAFANFVPGQEFLVHLVPVE